MPTQVSLVINFPSARYSPKTVKRNANEFVIGTVNDSSVAGLVSICNWQTQQRPVRVERVGTPPRVRTPAKQHLPSQGPIPVPPWIAIQIPKPPTPTTPRNTRSTITHKTTNTHPVTYQPAPRAKRTTRSPSNSTLAAQRISDSAASPAP